MPVEDRKSLAEASPALAARPAADAAIAPVAIAPADVVILTAGGPLARIVVNGLRRRLAPHGLVLAVVEEPAEGKAAVIRRRARLLGWPAALGQAAFGVLIRLMQPVHRRRLDAIIAEAGLDESTPAGVVRHAVASVNSAECRALLAALAPRVVAVYGTRILSRATLRAVAAPFVNYHAGINPKYRGQHPGYWALASGDAENAGVTIHLVDEGVDTGAVLYQARVAFTGDDSIATYQHVQAATAIPLFARAIEDALADRLAPRPVDLPSRQWFPPTLWQYLGNGLARGVW